MGASQRVCDQVKPLPYPAPPSALTFTAVGHAGNEWVVPVGPHRVTVRFTVTQRPGTQVARMWFEITHRGGEIRRFAPAGQDWQPGEHTATLIWDGRDDAGKPAQPGLYHLHAQVDQTAIQQVTCADGGPGIKYASGVYVAGLGKLKVG